MDSVPSCEGRVKYICFFGFHAGAAGWAMVSLIQKRSKFEVFQPSKNVLITPKS